MNSKVQIGMQFVHNTVQPNHKNTKKLHKIKRSHICKAYINYWNEMRSVRFMHNVFEIESLRTCSIWLGFFVFRF